MRSSMRVTLSTVLCATVLLSGCIGGYHRRTTGALAPRMWARIDPPFVTTKLESGGEFEFIQTSVTAGQSFQVEAEHNGVGTTGYRVTVDAMRVGPDFLLQPINGKITLPVPGQTKGPHDITVTAFGPSGETTSLPLFFTLADPLPQGCLTDGMIPNGYRRDATTGNCVPDPSCAAPLGNRVPAIFPTAFQRTGSGGSGSPAHLDFQLASPNSPITYIAVIRNVGEILLLGAPVNARGTNADLTKIGSIWFQIPMTGTFPLSLYVENAYGCGLIKSTQYQILVL